MIARGVVASRPVDEDGLIRPEWLTLFNDFPDRFVIGSDHFHGPLGRTPRGAPGVPPNVRPTWNLVDQLPEELAREIACENALMIYKLQ